MVSGYPGTPEVWYPFEPGPPSYPARKRFVHAHFASEITHCHPVATGEERLNYGNVSTITISVLRKGQIFSGGRVTTRRRLVSPCYRVSIMYR